MAFWLVGHTQTNSSKSSAEVIRPDSLEPATISQIQKPEDTKRISKYVFALAVLTTLLAIVSYRAAFGNYFTGDDFVYLNWLKLAAIEPQRMWSVFWSNSLEAQSTHFYRPFLSLSMGLDNYIWGRNALGFHLTNLFFHTICSALIFCFVKDFLLPENEKEKLALWPIFSASLFLLYPLHPEVVTWIGGRVDCVATSFVLASMYAFAKWRQTNKRTWRWYNLAAFMAGLCSKEFAIMLPPVCVVYELLCVNGSTSFNFKMIHKSFATTKGLWLTLVGYFLLRRISLGTFVGGYDDKLSLGVDMTAFCRNWLDSLALMLVPLNLSLITARNVPFMVAWLLFILAALGCLFRTYSTNRFLRAPIIFLVTTFFIFLVPVYKIMSIAMDLQSSRLAYLASVPLCCLLALGLSKIPGLGAKPGKAAIVVTLFLLLNAQQLKQNNKAWENAGVASNNIQKIFADLKKQGAQNCVVLGVPDCINGAYVARNALPEMHDKSLLVRSLPSVTRYEPLWALKDYLLKTKPGAVYRWNDQHLDLEKCSPLVKSTSRSITYAGKQLREIFPEEAANAFDEEGLSTTGSAPKKIVLKTIPRSAIDAITFTLESTRAISPQTMQIVFHNYFDGINRVAGEPNLLVKHERDNRSDDASAVLEKHGAKQDSICFALRGVANWQFDKLSSNQFLFCPNADGITRISSVTIEPMAALAPSLNVPELITADQPGLVEINSTHRAQNFSYSMPQTVKSKNILVEISQPNIWFDFPNAALENKDAFPVMRSFIASSGTFNVQLSNFNKPGDYYIRVWAVDGESEKATGLASDHVKMRVDLAQ